VIFSQLEEAAKSEFSTLNSTELAALTSLPAVNFSHVISDCFTQYMTGYIEMERKNLADLVDKFDREELWHNPEATPGGEDGDSSKHVEKLDRLASSNDLFQYIKSSVIRCSKLSKSTTLFDLFLEYKRGISLYTRLLDSKLPKKSESNQQLIYCKL
jgi:hypothetical protein